jgi:excisionase family DNA binding protein
MIAKLLYNSVFHLTLKYMETVEKEFLTIQEAQAFLGSSRTFVYNLIKSKALKRYHVGARAYLKRTEITNLFKSQ